MFLHASCSTTEYMLLYEGGWDTIIHGAVWESNSTPRSCNRLCQRKQAGISHFDFVVHKSFSLTEFNYNLLDMMMVGHKPTKQVGTSPFREDRFTYCNCRVWRRAGVHFLNHFLLHIYQLISVIYNLALFT